MVIQSRLMFKVLYSVAAATHFIFLLMFYNTGTVPMFVFNICSTLLYIAGVIMTFKSRHIDRHILGMTIVVYGEVTAHAITATILLGFEPAFLLYGIVILPMCAFTLFSADKKVFSRTTIIMCIISAALTIGTLLIINNNDGISSYPLTFEEIKMMRMFNVIAAIGMVFGFSFLFVNHINSLLKQLGDTNDQLNFLATHDPLTGLANRHSLWKFISVLRESGSDFCICMGDIDNFKRTNDTFGHDCGDQVLKSVADVIKNSIKKTDMACRWGGEEILVIMISGRDEAFERVSRMRRQISELDIWHEGQAVPTTMTFGFADSSENLNENDVNLESLISLVDKRLYDGKKSGKNKVVAK